MKILLAVDGSAHSDAAVDEIVRQHFPADSEVRIISAVEPQMFPGTLAADAASMSMYYAEVEKAERDQARVSVDKAAARLRANEHTCRLSVTTDVIFGLPKQVILDEAERFGADLIVVGSHGQGVLERFLLGSVSQAVALHARCSVEIVRRVIAKTQAGESSAQ
jgi:nucleotide-binding universal stress UspA family protein